jgi:FUS-interacting serine-arginine-rich protein 1
MMGGPGPMMMRGGHGGGPPMVPDRPGPPPGRRPTDHVSGRSGPRDEGPPGVSLLVRNVSPDITTNDLTSAFGRIGDIRDVYIPRDYHSQQPKGFAFIEYATAEQANEARMEMDRFVIKGRELEVVFAQERRKTPNEMRGRVVNQQNRGRQDGRGGGDGGGGGGRGRERSSSFERAKKQREKSSPGGAGSSSAAANDSSARSGGEREEATSNGGTSAPVKSEYDGGRDPAEYDGNDV